MAVVSLTLWSATILQSFFYVHYSFLIVSAFLSATVYPFLFSYVSQWIAAYVGVSYRSRTLAFMLVGAGVISGVTYLFGLKWILTAEDLKWWWFPLCHGFALLIVVSSWIIGSSTLYFAPEELLCHVVSPDTTTNGKLSSTFWYWTYIFVVGVQSAMGLLLPDVMEQLFDLNQLSPNQSVILSLVMGLVPFAFSIGIGFLLDLLPVQKWFYLAPLLTTVLQVFSFMGTFYISSLYGFSFSIAFFVMLNQSNLIIYLPAIQERFLGQQSEETVNAHILLVSNFFSSLSTLFMLLPSPVRQGSIVLSLSLPLTILMVLTLILLALDYNSMIASFKN